MLGFRLDADIQALKPYHLKLTLTNQLSEIDRINDCFNEFAETAEIPLPVSLKTNMVFDELLNNIISYAYQDQNVHEIGIQVNLVNSRLIIEVEDDGIPFNPFMRDDPNTQAGLDEREIGGLGIHLVKNVMDEVSYKRQLNRNRVTLIKQLDN